MTTPEELRLAIGRCIVAEGMSPGEAIDAAKRAPLDRSETLPATDALSPSQLVADRQRSSKSE